MVINGVYLVEYSSRARIVGATKPCPAVSVKIVVESSVLWQQATLFECYRAGETAVAGARRDTRIEYRKVQLHLGKCLI